MRYTVLVSVNGHYIECRESHTNSLHDAQELYFLEIIRLWRSAGDTAPGVYEIRIFDEEEDRDIQRAQIVYFDGEVKA
jgi:hypothetical protein